MSTQDNIIVTLTSYPKRIGSVHEVIKSILSNSLKPSMVVLNLSVSEFKNKEADLPSSITTLIDSDDTVRINWVDGPNTKQFKKSFNTLFNNKDSVIISVDDDVIYGIDTIDRLYKKYIEWDRACPITIEHGRYMNNMVTHCGSCSLFTYNMYGDYIYDLYTNFALPHVLDGKIRCFDDTIFTYASLLSGVRYKMVSIDSKELKFNEQISNGTKSTHESLNAWHGMIREYILNRYGKTLDDLFMAPIVVNVTTWKMRDKTLECMLNTIKEQSLHPDRIVLYLSKTEYENTIPEHISTLKQKGLITDVVMVEGNTYAHKRWEAFKLYQHCYNIMVDDDLLYPKDHIQTIVQASKSSGTPACYYSRTIEYSGNKRNVIRFQQGIDKKNALYSGLSCFPPYTFPVESYKYTELRDKYCTMCDDSWVSAWLIKNKQYIYGCNDWRALQCIDGTQENGIWETHNSKVTNGVMQKVINMQNAITAVGVKNEALRIWPTFNIPLIDCTTHEEKLIVTLTTWVKRIGNIPTVLDSILSQTKQADKIVLNLSEEEFSTSQIPQVVKDYLEKHSDMIEVQWIKGPNTKQWKKILPTMIKYPLDAIVCIDDDATYPSDMLKVLWDAHKRNPGHPVSGFNTNAFNMGVPHCGTCNLDKLEYYGDIFSCLTDEVLSMYSSDIFFTYMAMRAGHKHVWCGRNFISERKTFNEIDGLGSHRGAGAEGLNKMYRYLTKKYSTGKAGPITDTNSKQFARFYVG